MLLDFFQLREQPFSVSPHPSYLYSSRNRSEALESLTHAAASPCAVFALLGAAGVGKTTLLNQFLANFHGSTTRAILLPHTNFSLAEFMGYVLREIRTPLSDKTSSSGDHTLRELLAAQMRCGRGYVLFADNAHELDAPMLETICGLAQSEPGLSVILAGRPSLQDKLQRNPSPLSFVAKSLEALSGPETAAYIQHRLRVAGHPGIGLFERESLALIAERSQGILRNINHICFRALLEGYASGCRTLQPEIVEKAAQKLEFAEASQSVSKLQRPQGRDALPGTMPAARLKPPKKISTPLFLSQPLLRRAAVAALAATTLAIPYLAAKRISEAVRPGASTVTTASQISSPTPSKTEPVGVLVPAAPASRESESGTPCTPGCLPVASSRQTQTFAGDSSRRETARRLPDRSDNKKMEANGRPRFSLARELGLKINRIAIDAGHGGYDTGTIGPTGLMEKDLCLDVALRLGRMIKESVPGAEVIYTRTEDRFIPLEERTAIANDAQADLFISIHANSSDVPRIRGIETYYVSLDSSREARQIATRENAVGGAALHNLPDLIKKITRNENLSESRQLAAGIQNALSERLELVSGQETNRGVKRAPFIVLTGANMPAVLSEISFLSNPADERLLTGTDQRQHVTEGLYRGILTYLGTMPSHPLPGYTSGRTASSRSLEQTAGLR